MPGKDLVQPFTKEQAREYLKIWAKSHDIILIDEYNMTLWFYMEKPFWSAIWTGLRLLKYGQFGFHIHEDGEVIFIGKMEDAENQ